MNEGTKESKSMSLTIITVIISISKIEMGTFIYFAEFSQLLFKITCTWMIAYYCERRYI